MDTKSFLIGSVVVAIVFTGAFYLGFASNPTTFKGASGLAAFQQTATSTDIGPVITQVFAKLPSCATRVISTKATAIMLTFDDRNPTNISSSTLTNMVGFWQAASTTIAYDAELYGCGRWFGWSSASTTITTAEF